MHISHVGIIGAVYAHMSSFQNFRRVHEALKQMHFPENAFASEACAEPEANAFSGKCICFSAEIVENIRLSSKCVLGWTHLLLPRLKFEHSPQVPLKTKCGYVVTVLPENAFAWEGGKQMHFPENAFASLGPVSLHHGRTLYREHLALLANALGVIGSCHNQKQSLLLLYVLRAV